MLVYMYICYTQKHIYYICTLWIEFLLTKLLFCVMGQKVVEFFIDIFTYIVPVLLSRIPEVQEVIKTSFLFFFLQDGFFSFLCYCTVGEMLLQRQLQSIQTPSQSNRLTFNEYRQQVIFGGFNLNFFRYTWRFELYCPIICLSHCVSNLFLT